MFKMAFQVVFRPKNVPRLSFVLLEAPKPKKQGGAIMAPPRVTTSFKSMGKIGLNEEFDFACHKNNEITAKHILKTVDLPWNDLGTNTLPHSVSCKDICEVDIILIGFDATILCDDTQNTKNWECGLDQLDKELAPPNLRSSANLLDYLDDDEDIITKFVIYRQVYIFVQNAFFKVS